jgi:hypothetical protein
MVCTRPCPYIMPQTPFLAREERRKGTGAGGASPHRLPQVFRLHRQLSPRGPLLPGNRSPGGRRPRWRRTEGRASWGCPAIFAAMALTGVGGLPISGEIGADLSEGRRPRTWQASISSCRNRWQAVENVMGRPICTARRARGRGHPSLYLSPKRREYSLPSPTGRGIG